MEYHGSARFLWKMANIMECVTAVKSWIRLFCNDDASGQHSVLIVYVIVIIILSLLPDYVAVNTLPVSGSQYNAFVRCLWCMSSSRVFTNTDRYVIVEMARDYKGSKVSAVCESSKLCWL